MKRVLSVAASLCVVFGLAAAARGEEFLEEPTITACDPCGICDPCNDCGPARDCCDCFDNCDRFLGMLPSDHCFDDFISPLSNPFFFEDPRALTEVRGIFIENALPDIAGGGDVQVWTAQFRGRLTDRLSVIAPRLGYLQVNEGAASGGGGGGPVGMPSAPIGFKYTLLRNVDSQFIVSGGATYFIPERFGNFQIPGSGDFHFFLTGGKQILDRGHWLSGTGFRIPANNNWGTQFWYWSNQWDYEVVRTIYPLVGVNWFHFMSSAGANVGGNVTGLDLVNVPANGVAGLDIVSGVAGIKWKPNSHVELGVGYEFPLTTYTDILQDRLYVDAILRY